MAELLLAATELESPSRWRWVLTGPEGTFVTGHDVRLDEKCWQYEAFYDLQGYLRTYVAPDRRIAQEADIVAQVGDWIGRCVLGPIGQALAAVKPATVRVVVPVPSGNETRQAGMRRLLLQPLELARVGGCPLALQDVTLVMQTEPAGSQAKKPVGSKLRMLALFSLPVGARPLNLRRERQALVRRFDEIAAAGRDVDVQVVQYGVTRRRLRQLLADGDGWDIVHISGHGGPGELLLEAEDGTPDPVGAEELTGLLDLARGRLKLVSVSACGSAALTTQEQRRLLGVPNQEEGPYVTPGRVGALATALVDRLDCAVLAMRYSIIDEFAAELTDRLYDLLADQDQPLARALGIAVRQILAGPPTARRPSLSMATPALFGARAADLRLAAPPAAGPTPASPGRLKLAGFPAAPEHFVGRVGLMTRASAALAERSGAAGVLFYGMPGGGKTACAVELAYTHEHAFDQLAWFKAPDVPDTSAAVEQFALALETALPGLRLVRLVSDPAGYAAFLRRLTELFEQQRLLVVMDNIESLLTPAGDWRDARCQQLVGAMIAPSGPGRLVLTSRRRPIDMDTRMQVEIVDALPGEEALTLARELPHLGALIDGRAEGVTHADGLKLAHRVFNAAQGHPKLLELADGQAADPARLATTLTAVGGAGYLEVLEAWTRTVVADLRPGQRDLLRFLCLLEEGDRKRTVVDDNWADVWHRLDRLGPPPEPDGSFAALASSGLLAVGGDRTAGRGARRTESLEIHPAVAAIGRRDAGPEFRRAVDEVLAVYWTEASGQAGGPKLAGSQPVPDEREAGEAMVRAVLNAIPYLVRVEAWPQACRLVDAATARDRSAHTAAAVRPAMLAAATAVAGTAESFNVTAVLGKVMATLQPGSAAARERALLAAALDRQNYVAAAVTAGALTRLSREGGRLDEALQFAQDNASYVEAGKLGPWSRLAAEAGRLGVLAALGSGDAVLADLPRLRRRMESLPAESAEREVVMPWNAREMLLDAGRAAAVGVGRWADALDYNAAVCASQRARAAPGAVIAATQLNDYQPLIRLDRLEEAGKLLRTSHALFERSKDPAGLSIVMAGLSELESQLGHGSVATGLARDALRYQYLVGDVEDIRIGHHGLADMLCRHAGRGPEALAHHLACAVVAALGGAEDGLQGAAIDRAVFGAAAAFPAGLAELCRTTAQTPGVQLDQLLDRLCPDRRRAQEVLEDIVARVRHDTPPLTAVMTMWDPWLAALIAARQGSTDAATALDQHLASYQDADNAWGEIARALRVLSDGTKTVELPGLTNVSVAVVIRASVALQGQVAIPVELWRAYLLAPLIFDLVIAAYGDQEAVVRVRSNLLRARGADALLAVLLHILDGSRAPDLADGLEPAEQAVVTTVLFHIATTETQDPGPGRGVP
jgi:hypothetical protein